MAESGKSMKPVLELRELELTVRELELKVKNLEQPPYKRFSFWTGLITVLIALATIIGQSYLSSIKNAGAELEMKEALQKKAEALVEIKKANDSINLLQKKRDTLRGDLDKIIFAYNKVVSQIAYSDDKQDTADKTKTIVTETNNNVSDILLNNSSDLLLKNAILKVYYIPGLKEEANAINNLLKSYGVKSEYLLPGYDISKAKENQIVYYNKPQLNYCKAVQKLLQIRGFGYFPIRLSSGENSTTHHFKIYVLK